MLGSAGARIGSMLVVSFAAGWLVHDRPLTAFDASLPIVAAALSIAAWIARSPALDVAPLALIVTAIAVVDDSTRLLAYGAIASVVIASAVLIAARGGRLERAEAISLAIVIVAMFRLVPLEGRRAIPELVVFAGLALLVLASSVRGRVPMDAMAVAVLAAILAPADPARASLFPLILAASCWFLRGGGLLAALAAVPLAIVAGGWALPVAGAAIVMRLVEERRGALAVRWLFAAGLLALGIASRPALAVLYFASGLVFALNARDRSIELSSALVAYLSAAAILLGWSGVLFPAFPLPFSPAEAALVIGLVLLGALVDWKWISVPAAALFLFALVSFPPHVADRHPVEVALAPGQPIDIPPTRPTRSLDLVLSGANISHLEPGTVVGTIEVLTERGAGLRRQVRIGDVADWGAFREGHRFRTKNLLPLRIARLHGVGASAYPSGAGVIRIVAPEIIAYVRVTAERSLPPDARL
ncbi:MAG TPA: hypothetical protein VIL97_05950, partial [Thermoanaerobaculia bacterium]